MWAGECVGATGSMGVLCGMAERGRTSSRISGDWAIPGGKRSYSGGDLLLS